MPAKSTYLANKLLEHTVGKTAYTMPVVYLALCTVAPVAGDTGSTITEASYTGYTRLATAGTDWNAASAQSISNANAFTWPACTAGGATVVAIALVDAAAAGNLLRSGAASLAIAPGVPIVIPVGGLVITEA